MEIKIYYDTCSGCGGSGKMPGIYSQDPLQNCSMCGGIGKQVLGTIEGVPNTEQFLTKFQLIEDALTAIWDKVKDL